MRFLILFTFLVSNTLADDLPKIKNMVIHKDLKTYDNVIFLDQKDQKISIKDFKGNLVLLNFWATWCEPCKEEMPSLDRLQNNSELNNIKIFPINISQESLKKIDNFFQELNIEYLDPYFDAPTTLAKTLSLRGVPTSILFNLEGKEFARIMGSIDFDNLEFIEWLKTYN
ncbi:TlpA disulfide reductase family protein [Candidatus Pelagibacter sp.]|jgi:thiol-disulfide isomerase/thioredoxin|nr:TlpA family protein disulfide reductase [Candidatus Pelagibacter sp.]MDB3895571.1 TlpA family protein disulfide reductase [Candidatus Pelagibacter sp.]MDC0908280.1 TlpA disulfide reductase family protein [Candidatus Pelagibacter sp.]|tara:strand:- start:206 stop:715 length:510 start_codon:yes stop_codon:yes gene_type:complete